MAAAGDAAPEAEAIGLGLLRDGTRFCVPETTDVLTALFSPRSWRSPATLGCLAAIAVVWLTGVLHFTHGVPVWFFCAQFVFWRLAYNIGIGVLLHRQSHDGWFLAWYRSAVGRWPALRRALETAVVLADGKPYTLDAFPDEFNAWMLFRQIENVVLANDLVSYVMLSVVCAAQCERWGAGDALGVGVGLASIVFAVWSKADAHRVIGDFAWYWGDFFFLLDKELVFDGIFQMFPHPMYTVGYAFMYGVPLMAKSYTLFYVSVFGHLCQLAFLAFVETPHIDRTYSQFIALDEEEERRRGILYSGGEEAYLEHNELVVLLHFDMFRASDLLLALVLLYLVCTLYFPIPAWAYVVHYVLWRAFHNGFLGYLLREESRAQWFSRHYHTPQRAFANWKRIYNASVTITNISYCLCAWKLFTWSMPLMGGGDARVFCVVVGLLLIGVNAYVSASIYGAVGDFGYFYGDFFVRDVPARLNYSGVYRYLNNPDSSLGMAAYYGIALISGNGAMGALALLSHVATKAFERFVEAPHMRRTYGAEVRSAGGMRTELKRRVTSSQRRYSAWLGRLTEGRCRASSCTEHQQELGSAGTKQKAT